MITTLLWSSPLLVVVLLLASGRVSTMQAGAIGVLLALAVASTSAAPVPLSPAEAARSIGRGLWLAWLAGSVIFGGLFFQQVLAGAAAPDPSRPVEDDEQQRRRLFAACFLIGPFTESATGFGIGYVITLSLIGRLDGLRPRDRLVFGLFSQTFVPWGALAVGTLVGAHLAHLPTAELGMHSAILNMPLLLGWLILFWRLAAASGLRATAAQKLDELAWLAAAALLLVAANRLLDAEVAAVASLGPLIALRFWRDMRPTRAEWCAAAHVAAPYAALAAILIAARAIPPLRDALSTALVIQPPLADTSPYMVLLHPFVWLMAVAASAAILSGRAARLGPAFLSTWRSGRAAIAATLLFLVMAQLLAGSGIANALAGRFLTGLGPAAAVTVSPVFAAIGGILTGSTTGSNGLFMLSQVALGAAAGLPDIGWLAAVQNTAGSAATMLSPIRVAMGCALLGRPDLERATYRAAWPLGAVPLALMALVAAALVLTLAP